MPIVPRVGPAPLPGVRVGGAAPEAAFGGGAGNASVGLMPGLSAVHTEASQIVQEERVRADQIALTDAGARESEVGTDVLYGPDGALTKKGKDAFDTPETTRDAYFKRTAEISAGLGSDDQRAAFQRIVVNNWSRINEQLQRHVAQQKVSYDTDSTDAFVANKQNEALKAYSDPIAVTGAINEQRAAITGYGQRNGWADEQTKQAVAKQISSTHVGVISQFLDSEQDITAQQYFQQHRDEISAIDQAKIDRALKAGSTLGEAQRATKQILGDTTTATDALARAEAITDPKVQKEAIQLVTAHFGELDRAQRIDRENARARVLQDVEGNKGRLNRASQDWQLIDGYPEGEHVLERQQQILHPPPDRGDPDKYAGYVAMAATSPATRQALLSTSIREITDDETLSGGQKTAIINLIRGERQRDVVDLRSEASAAEQEAKRLEQIVKKAQQDGNQNEIEANTPYMYASQQRATLLRGRVITATRAAHFGVVATPDAATPPTAPETASHSTGLSSFGLSSLKPVTPEMLRDIATHGAGYAEYLRKSGYDVPAVLPKAPTP